MRIFNIIVQVELEDNEIPAENDWKAWTNVARAELMFGEIYNVIEAQ